MTLNRWLPYLIKFWRKQAKINWAGGPADKLLPEEAKSIAAGIRRLSSGLTADRLLAGETYFNDPTLFGAYLLYFWPVSYVQAYQILSTLPSSLYSLLDLGCGGGPLAAAAYDCGIQDITLADRSSKALACAKALFSELSFSPKIIQWDPTHTSAPLSETYNLIASQHCFNELWIESQQKIQKRSHLARELLTYLSANGFLLFIDPALKSTSQELLQLRDCLCAHGAHIVFPCLHSLPCPALKADNSCHVESPWDPPVLIRDLIQRAGLQKRVLKTTTLLFQQHESNFVESSRKFLVVTEPKRAKNKSIYVSACSSLGRVQISIMPSEVTPFNRSLLKVKPGNIFTIDHFSESNHELKLSSESQVMLFPQNHPFQIKA